MNRLEFTAEITVNPTARNARYLKTVTGQKEGGKAGETDKFYIFAWDPRLSHLRECFDDYFYNDETTDSLMVPEHQ